MQMRVDHHPHIDRRESVNGEGIGDAPVDDTVLAKHRIRSPAAGVDEHDSEFLVQDHEPVHRPWGALDVEVSEVEALDLHAHRTVVAQTGSRPHSRMRLNG